MFEKNQTYALTREGNETPDLVRVVFAKPTDTPVTKNGMSGGQRVLVADLYNPSECRWADPANLTKYTGAAGTKFA